MPAHLEPIVYIVRAGPTFTAPPDKYACLGNVTIDEDGVATIRGLAGRMSRALRDEIVGAIKARGYTEVHWRTRKNGKWVTHSA